MLLKGKWNWWRLIRINVPPETPFCRWVWDPEQRSCWKRKQQTGSFMRSARLKPTLVWRFNPLLIPAGENHLGVFLTQENVNINGWSILIISFSSGILWSKWWRGGRRHTWAWASQTGRTASMWTPPCTTTSRGSRWGFCRTVSRSWWPLFLFLCRLLLCSLPIIFL